MAPARTKASVSVVFPLKLTPGKMIARPSCSTAPAWTNVLLGAAIATLPRIWLSSIVSEYSRPWPSLMHVVPL